MLEVTQLGRKRLALWVGLLNLARMNTPRCKAEDYIDFLIATSPGVTLFVTIRAPSREETWPGGNRCKWLFLRRLRS